MIMKVGLKHLGLKANGSCSDLTESETGGQWRYLVGNSSSVFSGEATKPFAGLLRTNTLSLTDAAAPALPVSRPLPGRNGTGCFERSLELNKALAESGGPAEPFLTC